MHKITMETSNETQRHAEDLAETFKFAEPDKQECQTCKHWSCPDRDESPWNYMGKCTNEHFILASVHDHIPTKQEIRGVVVKFEPLIDLTDDEFKGLIYFETGCGFCCRYWESKAIDQLHKLLSPDSAHLEQMAENFQMRTLQSSIKALEPGEVIIYNAKGEHVKFNANTTKRLSDD